MRDRKPASFNVVPEDTIGTTWALPEGAIARFGKGDIGDVKLSPDGTYFAVGTGMGLWWYDVSSMSPISLWETKRGLVNSIDFPMMANGLSLILQMASLRCWIFVVASASHR